MTRVCATLSAVPVALSPTIAIPRAITAPMANYVVLLGMITSIPTKMGTVRHRECEATHTLQQKFFPLEFCATIIADED
jgi:hypothetical protein